jgi:hypothetical protein
MVATAASMAAGGCLDSCLGYPEPIKVRFWN